MELTKQNKKIVEGFWTAETELYGKPIQDTYIEFVGLRGVMFPRKSKKIEAV